MKILRKRTIKVDFLKNLHHSQGLLDDVHFINFEGDKPEDKASIKAIKIALYNNLAACYLKMNDFNKTIMFCSYLLTLDPNQAKALYAIIF